MSPLLTAIAITTAAAIELHIAPNGDDGADGSVNAPFATVARARDAIRILKSGTVPLSEAITVSVHPGQYAIPRSISFEARDSGAPEAPITYQAEGEVRLYGGKLLPAEAFFPIAEQEIIARVPEGAREAVRALDLKAQGITDLGLYPDNFEGAPALPELFFNGSRMTLAQWPNEGWAEIAQVVDSGPAPWRNHTSDGTGTFEYSGDEPTRWLAAPAVWLEGYWCFDWAAATIRIGAIDTEKRQITLASPHHYGIGSGNPAARRYRAINLLEELDVPGEYFIDREAGVLYFIPPAALDTAHIVLSTLTQPMLQVDNSEHLTFEGFTFEACAGTAVQFTGGKHITLAGCTFRNTGQDGIVIEGGEAHTVQSCNLDNIGTTGIRIGGGDRKTLTPSKHQVLNNHIRNVSQRMRTHAYNLQFSGVGIHVAHNLISDAPHQAIMVAGNDHLFEYNEVCRVGMESDDCGAFYMGRNPSERGTVIRYNYWHDIGSTMAHGSAAIYFDDGAGGQTVHGNVFHNASGGQFGAIFTHGGHDNIVSNNLFIDCSRAIASSPWPDDYWTQWMSEPLWQKALLQDVDITSPTYLQRYPELKDYMQPGNRLRLNRANNNLAIRCGALVNGNWLLTNNLTLTQDPGFIDAAANNFSLSQNAPILEALPDFEPIPFDEIGLHTDAHRKAL